MQPDEVDKAVQDQKVAAALVIPQGFGATVEAGKSGTLVFIRIETSSGAQSVQRAVEAVVSQFNNSKLVAKTAAEQVASRHRRRRGRGPARRRPRSLAEAQLASPVVTSKHGRRRRRR